jgi:putative acetyltransferase
MTKLIRSDTDHPDFRQLADLLDTELTDRYGEVQKRYNELNRLGFLDTVVVAYQNDSPAGCGCFRAVNGETAEIKRMYVKPAFRSHGIGQLILNELETWAQNKGFRHTILETGSLQPEAIRLYEKCGYRVIDCYGNYEGDENSVCMKKRLFPEPDA